MTKQEAYERIRAHFVADRRYGYRPATAETEAACVYLAADGAKCAIGCLMPDGNPMQEAQGGIFTLARDYTKHLADLLGIDATETRDFYDHPTFKFLNDVQAEHDFYAANHRPIDALIERLDQMAEHYRLQVVSA